MRTLMRETVLLLLSRSGSDVLVSGSAQVSMDRFVGTLAYADFTALRPEFAASSWRGILNRLVEQRYVVKIQSQNGVRFRLTKLGEQWATQNLFSGVLAGDSSQVSVVILKPQSQQSQQYNTARRLLEEQGYYHVISGVYASQSGRYSDLLWQSLHQAGFVAVFLRLAAGAIQPVGFRELLGDQQDEFTFQRKFLQIDQRLRELIVRNEQENGLTPKEKSVIGEILVSGLSLVGEWSPLLYGQAVPFHQIKEMLESLLALGGQMRLEESLVRAPQEL